MSKKQPHHPRKGKTGRTVTHISVDEYTVQCQIFSWAQYQMGKHPELRLLYSTLNGVRLPLGLARKCKAAGLIAGVPDIVLPCARAGFHGLYLELKVGDNYPSKAQREFMALLIQENYRAVPRWGFDQATQEIMGYLTEEIYERPKARSSKTAVPVCQI